MKFQDLKKIKLSEPLLYIKRELKKKRKKPLDQYKLTSEEILLIRRIKEETSRLNINNITRTKAYFEFYRLYPEIHWAFLGHMVSRNGGWNMTDLKGEILSRILTKREAELFFTFLERGNWLIFQDVYPQLLVYQESLKRQQNLFHLLKHMNISIFMEVIWDYFWLYHDLYILTVAQIMNEQSYLEQRVLKDHIYKKEILDSIEFKLQDLLSMNHILFPFLLQDKIKLIGQTLHHFESLHERIMLGKRLYFILFRNQTLLNLIERWAEQVPHTGSRKDYWPHIFNDVDEGVPGTVFKPKIKSCELLPSATKIYSPRLDIVWKNRKQEPAEIIDWYKDWKIIYYLMDKEEKADENIEKEYCKTLERLELAANTKKIISHFY
ncbi:DUF2515 family protein [Bacillus sp. FJAT-49736]|uniref:DUF2515 family protein n=1 Tax=Bacillus sp. FJAT-49736 TaxID=2833582 RepID=UPI001BC8CBAC|nr:DUF2515 family protein [Bacillus sp. FJAT-49736]MBS4173032.1 DUF2515 family protein [Bacillus sp. FJAT-49736]